MDEVRLHDVSSFVTLTYGPEHLPPGESLRYSDVQAFLKRLRKWAGRPLRFFCCGEYGPEGNRPHYHLILFGLRFDDSEPWSRNPNGDVLYRSAVLERLWRLGFCTVGAVTEQSAGYVARYSLKKVTGDAGKRHYGTYTCPETGSIVDRTAEFARMSLKPGIGAEAYAKWADDYHRCDRAVSSGGKRDRVPRYYDKLLKRSEEDRLEELKFKREQEGKVHFENNTAERLVVREVVAEARCQSLKLRSLK